MIRLSRLFAPLLALLAQPALAADPAPPARPALWKVADADTTIWLFGTIHALPAGIDWFGGEVERAFDGSQELVTEIVPPDVAAMQGLVLDKAMLPKGQSLRASMTPEARLRYEAALGSMKLPPAAFDAFEPWYAAVGLSTLPLMQDGFATANGVEEALDTRARSVGRVHTALETAEYQLSLFDGLPADAQQRYLADVVGNLPKVRAQLAAMVEAWKGGDPDRLAALMNEEENDPALLKALLTDRNKAWAEWIGARLDRPGEVFMAVGAGHLAGKGSVQDQLSERGILAARVQ
jgi:uncharacterized protein